MAWYNTGDSWFKVIFNPVGYLANSQSIDKSVSKYASSNPPSQILGSAGLVNTSITYDEFVRNGQRWVDGCTLGVKSQDVGKSKVNIATQCQSAWDQDGNVIDIRNQIEQNRIAQNDLYNQQNKEMISKIFVFVIVLAVIALIIYLLTSK